MSLTGQAINYLQNQFPKASFLTDIILQDDGQGPYVKYWGVGSPQPTEEEQLHLLYEDQKNNTKTFSERIDVVGTSK